MGPFHLSIAFLLWASITIAISIPAIPTWPSGRCTDKSLTIPSWVIFNYSVIADTARFQIYNRATADSWNQWVTCPSGHAVCDGEQSIRQTKLTRKKGADGKTEIGFYEFWTCEDAGDPTVFSATGSVVITSCVGTETDCVSPITYMAPGSLTLPVPLTPAQPKPPPGYNSPSCATVGKNQWTVAGVEWRNYTKGQCKSWYWEDYECVDPGAPLEGFVSKGQHLKLNVTNAAISHEVYCAFDPKWDSDPAYNKTELPIPLRCTGGDLNEITLDASWTGTAPNFNLKIEELWYCLENPATNNKDSAIVASGSIPLKLSCESHPGITGKPEDIITICTDPETSHAVDGTQVEKQILPPWSLVTAYPAHGGCTFDSVISPTFRYRSMWYETNEDGETFKMFTAGLHGPGFRNYYFYQKKAISGSGVDAVYPCTVYYDGQIREHHYNCTYSFNANTNVITQTKAWECNDKDPIKPIYFDGFGSFDWSIDPFMIVKNLTGKAKNVRWIGDQASEVGIPYSIQKVTASLVNVLPPEYAKLAAKVASSDTVRINGKWQKAGGD